MKVEIEDHTGIMYNGMLVKFAQWRVFATGYDGNRVCVGYLSHDPDMALMPIANQANSVWKEVIEKLEKLVGRKVIPPEPIYEPPTVNAYVSDEEEDDD